MMERFKKERYIILLLALVCSFFFFFKLGSYKLIDVDEPRYAEAAREMLESSDWITPYFNYQLRFDKPIFFYWLIALSYLIFGVCEFAARFPSAILSVALVFFTYYFGRTTISKSFGLISALILASSLEFIAMGRMTITDMTLAFFICASIYSGLLATFAEEKYKKYWWWFSYLFSGIAVLTKGPVGLALPGIVIGSYLILIGKVRESLQPKFLVPGILIFAFSAIPWYYAVIQKHGETFINYFFIKHNLARFASSGFKQHSQPFYFYFIVVIAGFFPWITYFVASLIKAFSGLYKYISANKPQIQKFDLAIFKNADNKLKVSLASSLWFLIIFLFFSSSKAKLVTYILPLFPAMALLTGSIWNEYIVENKSIKSINISAKIFSVLCFIMAAVAIFGMNYILPRDEKINGGYISIALAILFIILPAILLIFLNKKQSIKAFASSIVFMMGIIVVVLFNILPAIYNSGPKDLVEYATISRQASFSDTKLFVYLLEKPSVIFYAKKEVPKIQDLAGLKKLLSYKEPALIITKNKHLDKLSKEVKFNIVKKGERYCLISNIKVTIP